MFKFGLKGKMLSIIIALLLISFAAVAISGYIQAKNIIINNL